MPDPSWSNVKLHVTADASPVEDLGPVGYALTFNGNAARSTAQAKFGAASIAFDGVNDNVSTTTSFDFDLSATGWTMRLHFRLGTLTGADQAIFTIYLDTNNWIQASYQHSTGKIYFVARGGGVSRIASVGTGPSISTGQWYHLAMSHSGTTTRGFIDGAQVVSNVTAISYSSGAYYVRLGENRLNGEDFNGWIDEVQFSREAVYTGGFTAPTGPYPYNAELAVSGFSPTAFGSGARIKLPLAIPSLGMVTTFGSHTVVYDVELPVEGFAPVSFGVPSLNNVLAVEGFEPVSFGTPELAKVVLGFAPVTFGTPEILKTVSGFNPVAFGTPTCSVRNRVRSLGNVARFGRPSLQNVPQELLVKGFAPVKFGICPALIRYNP